MQIQPCYASIPSLRSLSHTITRDPAIGVVASADLHIAPDLIQGKEIDVGEGQKLVPLKPEAIGRANYDKLIGKQLTLADLGLSLTQQGVQISGLKLPDGADTVFEVAGLVVSSANTYHAFTREDGSVWDMAISSATTLSVLGDLLAPALPPLAHYQPALKFATLLLKSAKTYGEVTELQVTAKILPDTPKAASKG